MGRAGAMMMVTLMGLEIRASVAGVRPSVRTQYRVRERGKVESECAELGIIRLI